MNHVINFSLIASLFLCFQINAQTIYVKQNATGAGDGTSWTNAFTQLDAALAEALPGVHVWVAAGTYKPDTTLVPNNHFSLPAGVELYGGFSGTESTLDQRNPEANVTVLSGDTRGDDIPLADTVAANRSDNSIHVLWVRDGDSTQRAVIDGFVIRNGASMTAGSVSTAQGGGILVTAPLTVRNCRFSENMALAGGSIAAVGTAATGLVVDNCTFQHNYSSLNGAGLYIEGTNASNISNCTFHDNITRNGTVTIKGIKGFVADSCLFENNQSAFPNIPDKTGLYSLSSSFLLKNSTFRNNRFNSVHLEGFPDDTMTVDRCIFEKNRYSGNGAGIYIIWSNNTTIKNCVFRNDTAANGAGIFYFGVVNFPYNVLIDSCLFENNYTTEYGGAGIYNVSAGVQITNSTFRGNLAPNANAIYNESSNVIIGNCTFENGQSYTASTVSNFGGNVRFDDCLFQSNKGGFYGGAVLNGGGVNAVVNNCTFHQSSAFYGGAMFNQDDFTKVIVKDCLFDDNTAGTSGGAMYNGTQSNIFILNSVIRENTALYGGAVYTADNSTALAIQSCTFENNFAESLGGALYMEDRIDTEISASLFKSNSAPSGGAIKVTGDFFAAGTLSVYNSQFNENESFSRGGAIDMANLKANFVNTLFHANHCTSQYGRGGAISHKATFFNVSEMKAVNCTFTDNLATMGAGISQFEGSVDSTVATLQNCIFANDPENYDVEEGTPAVFTNGGNLSSDASLASYLTGSNDLNSSDPQLMDPDNYNFYPAVGSPCINGGVADGSPVDDLAGNLRIGIPDKGSYEFGTVSTQNPSAPVSFRISPNPASEFVNAQIRNEWIGEVSIRVHDASGVMVLSTKDEKTDQEGVFWLNIKKLPAGMYLVRIQTGTDSYTGKMFKAL